MCILPLSVCVCVYVSVFACVRSLYYFMHFSPSLHRFLFLFCLLSLSFSLSFSISVRLRPPLFLSLSFTLTVFSSARLSVCPSLVPFCGISSFFLSYVPVRLDVTSSHFTPLLCISLLHCLYHCFFLHTSVCLYHSVSLLEAVKALYTIT